ncbi:hypothetical protein [Fusibacter bizertensis]
MRLLTNIISVLAIISLLSTLICGLWIKQQINIETSSIEFHKWIGIISVILAVLALILNMIKK